MKAQKPAEGILLYKDWGNSKVYHVQCNCTDDDHSHDVDIESDDHNVIVTVYTKQTTDYWSEKIKPRYNIDNDIYQNIHWYFISLFNSWYRRSKLIWQILTKGRIEYHASIVMTEQQALNYAETLHSAVKDVKMFKNEKSNRGKINDD